MNKYNLTWPKLIAIFMVIGLACTALSFTLDGDSETEPDWQTVFDELKKITEKQEEVVEKQTEVVTDQKAVIIKQAESVKEQQ